MPSEFRFLVMCTEPTPRDGAIDLKGVVNTVHLRAEDFPTDLKMFAIVSAIVGKPMWGKSLDLMAWQLDNKGARATLVKYRGTPLIIPEAYGPLCMPYEITVPIWSSGVYGFDLFDRDGVFGKPKGLLATYLYGVTDSPAG